MEALVCKPVESVVTFSPRTGHLSTRLRKHELGFQKGPKYPQPNGFKYSQSRALMETATDQPQEGITVGIPRYPWSQHVTYGTRCPKNALKFNKPETKLASFGAFP